MKYYFDKFNSVISQTYENYKKYNSVNVNYYGYNKYNANSANYYTYGKYNAVLNYNSPSGFSLISGGNSYTYAQTSGYTGQSFSSSVGFYTTGSNVSFPTYSGQVVYSGGYGAMTRYTCSGVFDTEYFVDIAQAVCYADYVQGSYITNVVALDGTYPSNGYSGGFWYVRGSIDHTNYSQGSYILSLVDVDGTYPVNGMQSGYWYARGALDHTTHSQGSFVTDLVALLGTYSNGYNGDGYFYTDTGLDHYVYAQGTLVQADIIAESTAYPINARYTDGFWYVRKGVYTESNSFFGQHF